MRIIVLGLAAGLAGVGYWFVKPAVPEPVALVMNKPVPAQTHTSSYPPLIVYAYSL